MQRIPLALPRHMRGRSSSAILLAGLVLLTGCAWTSMNSYRDPTSHGRDPMSGIAIFAVIGDLGLRQTVELVAAKRFTELTSTRAVRAMDLLPPTRQISAQEATKTLLDSGIDGVLFMILTDAYTETYQAPGMAMTSGFASIYGNSINYQGQTTYVPGARTTKPRNTYNLMMADLRTGDIVWIASTFTRGNGYADTSVMTDSLVRSTIKELLAERLLLPLTIVKKEHSEQDPSIGD